MKETNAKEQDTRYIRDFPVFRRILRLFSYGYNTRDHFIKNGIHGRTYDKAAHRLRFFLGSDFLLETRRQRNVHLSFSGDGYKNTVNLLYKVFQIKSVSPEFAQRTCFALQILNKSEKPLSLSEFYDLLCDFYPEILDSEKEDGYKKRHSIETYRRHLDELAEWGYIKRSKIKNKYIYQRAPNPFSNLSEEELHRLYWAVVFAANTELIGLLGYYCMNTIQGELLRQNFESAPSPAYQFKHNAPMRILDDALLCEMVQAIRAQDDIEIMTQKKKALLRPKKILTEYVYNRQYVIAQMDKHIVQRRIDSIDTAQRVKRNAAWKDVAIQTKKRKRVVLKFHADEKQQIILRRNIQNTFQNPLFSEESATAH